MVHIGTRNVTAAMALIMMPALDPDAPSHTANRGQTRHRASYRMQRWRNSMSRLTRLPRWLLRTSPIVERRGLPRYRTHAIKRAPRQARNGQWLAMHR